MHIFKHLHTVNTHRRAVRKLCFKCGLIKQGLMHDLSKYSPTEFIPSVKYWTGKKSPIDTEIEKTGHSEAWLHHKGRNKHHYEYWLDPVHFDVPAEMPLRYVAEMFCDRVAASKTYLKDKYTPSSPMEYYRSRPQEKQLMNPVTYELIGSLFEMLEQKGEDETCAYIRKLMKESDS